MSGVNKEDPAILINYGELNAIYNKLNEVDIRDEYVKLDYEHYQLVRCIEALRLYIEEFRLDPQFKVDLHE